ncbi:MAG: hypothetical protein AAF962_05820 [Actinomycetota bacterium]
MTNTTTHTNTCAGADTARRRWNHPLLGIAFLGIAALGASGCYTAGTADRVPGGAAAPQASADAPTTSIATRDRKVADPSDDRDLDEGEAEAEADDAPPAPLRDLSATGEGENVYVDGVGTMRNAGTDEPICPDPLRADGRDANGDYILIDGRFGLPLCGPDGVFLTIPGDHEDTDVDEGAVPLTPELEFLQTQLELGWTDGVHCRITSGTAADVFQGPCLFHSEGGGSFAVQAADGGPLTSGVQLITVSITAEGEAEVRGLTTDGANSRWGAAVRSETEPACWVGTDFEVCAF